jgi:hypothetical protein
MVQWLTQVCPTHEPVLTVCLPAKKWHWRLRASSLHLAAAIPVLSTPEAASRTTLFVSSMTNLVELVGLRADLQSCHKVYYMHENQLVYPTQRRPSPAAGAGSAAAGASGIAAVLPAGGAGSAAGGPVVAALTEHAAASAGAEGAAERDFQFGWAQVLSCLAADVVAWNSVYNMASFCAAVDAHMRVIPDSRQRVLGTADLIRRKSRILYFPVPPPVAGAASLDASDAEGMPRCASLAAETATSRVSGARLRLAWNHRWEYDKAPDVFFDALRELHDKGDDFEVVVLGERFAEAPACFEAARTWLSAAGKVVHWGYAEDKAAYFCLLAGCDVVVSTAIHEFFGVAVLEAVLCGCYPLCPADLSYPEIFAPTSDELAAAAGEVLPGGGDASCTGDSAAAPLVRSTLSLGQQLHGLLAGSGSAGAHRPTGQRSRHGERSAPVRKSAHLYSGPSQLRRALGELMRRPEAVRAWRRDTLLPQIRALAAGPPAVARGSAAGAAAASSAGLCSDTSPTSVGVGDANHGDGEPEAKRARTRSPDPNPTPSNRPGPAAEAATAGVNSIASMLSPAFTATGLQLGRFNRAALQAKYLAALKLAL